MHFHRLALSLVAISLALLTVFAKAPLQRQPTAPEKKAEMIRLIQALETTPFGKGAKEARREVLLWLTDAPDVTVTMCPQLLVDLKKFKGDEGAALVGQLAFSEAKFILENPDKAKNAGAVHMAGTEGVIRTYTAMKADKPKLSIEPMEHLLQLQSQGKLPEHVTSAIASCK